MNRLSTMAAAAALLAAPLAVRAQASMAEFTVRAVNRLATARADETIGIPWKTVRGALPSAVAGQLRVRDAGSGLEIPSQAFDDDGDGATDELIFQSSFAPHEARRFIVEAHAPAPVADTRVYAAHESPRDDVAWESDRIAFRIYGQGLWKVDSLNSSGVDVWVKRVRTPIVDKWYAKGHDEYHHDNGEGADFFDVGESLGAGGTGIWRNDSLYRALNFKTWRIIANGPVRTIFELTYQPFNAGGLRVSEVKRVALDAGHNLNHVVSTFKSERASAAEIPWVSGIVKRAGVVGSESKANDWAWLAEWGPILPKDGGHGELGIGILLPRSAVADWKETNTHYLVLSHARSGVPVDYYIGAGWTDSGDFRDVRDWWRYLDDQAQRIATPIVVTIDPVKP
jgi:pectinesterase